MAKKTLFPVFDVPETIISHNLKTEGYQNSVYFDFESGDFIRDGSHKMIISEGKEAYIQWCRKIIMTERFSCLSYDVDIGTEMYAAMSLDDVSAVESGIERTINEALMVNPMTEYVRGFEFQWNADAIYCSFIIKGKDWEEQNMSIKIN